MIIAAKKNLIDYDKTHGGPFDRGAADSYYRRPPKPHCYPNGTYNGPEVLLEKGKPEYDAYVAGYAHNEWVCNHKEWD